MDFDRLLKTKITIPFLVFLLVISLFTFFISSGPVRGQDNPDDADDRAWPVQSYVWNRRLNLWGRTDCTMTIGGVALTPVETRHNWQSCQHYDPLDATSVKALGHVRYYHDIHPPGGFGFGSYGQLRGHAWSPLYGLIHFNQEDFPADDVSTIGKDESECYGLQGNDRQARIYRYGETSDNDGNTLSLVRLVGCAYVPFLRDYILFNKEQEEGKTINDPLFPSNWDGVSVSVVETDATAYLTLHGCAWSSKNNLWSFGPNEGAVTDDDNCLPSRHNTGLKNVLPEAYLGGPGRTITPTLNVSNANARIGQEIGYKYDCPDGYAIPELAVLFGTDENSGKRIIDVVLDLFSGWHRTIFVKSFSKTLLTCKDKAEIFTRVRDNSSEGIYVEGSPLISSFEVTPSVVYGGGLVTFGGSVINQGSFNDVVSGGRIGDHGGVSRDVKVRGNYASCAIVNKVTGSVVRSFDADKLNISINASDLVVRDTIYELACRYRKYNDIGNPVWDYPSKKTLSVKVLPSRVVERNISSSVGLPVITDDSEKVYVDIPSGASEVYVHKLRKGVIGNSVIDDINSIYKIFVHRSSVQNSDSEDDVTIKSRLFSARLHSKVSVINGSRGSLSRDDLSQGDVLVAEARNRYGQWSQKVAHTYFANGVCDEGRRSGCFLGGVDNSSNANDVTKSADFYYRWNCPGAGGGVLSHTCEISKATCGTYNTEWTNGDGSITCTGGVINDSTGPVSSGSRQRAVSDSDIKEGSAVFECRGDGAWYLVESSCGDPDTVIIAPPPSYNNNDDDNSDNNNGDNNNDNNNDNSNNDDNNNDDNNPISDAIDSASNVCREQPSSGDYFVGSACQVGYDYCVQDLGTLSSDTTLTSFWWDDVSRCGNVNPQGYGSRFRTKYYVFNLSESKNVVINREGGHSGHYVSVSPFFSDYPHATTPANVQTSYEGVLDPGDYVIELIRLQGNEGFQFNVSVSDSS